MSIQATHTLLMKIIQDKQMELGATVLDREVIGEI